MRCTDKWLDYELLDASDGERLERWGEIILIRPDTQIIWNTPKKDYRWNKAHARYIRSNSGGGHWEYYKKIPETWNIKYDDLGFVIKPMGFKHTGVFPEQAVNWDFAMDKISKANRPINVLNLFGYTGGATVACLKAGASVCHVDASKGMVNMAKENSALSGVSDKPVRWIVDDCVKFVNREIRRGRRYDAIIMDPPSYGRGPNGEVWKLETELFPLLELCKQVLSDEPLFFLLNSYTSGLSPAVMEYTLTSVLKDTFGGQVTADEIGLRVSSTNLVLPCGNTAIWER